MTLLLDPPRPVAPDIHADATRREFLAGAGAALLLAACGADEATDTATPTTTKGDSAFPVTIEHKFGSTEIPSEPKRVLSLGFNEHDAILALGVKPVATRYWFGDESDVVFPWAEDEFADAQGPVSDPEILNMLSTELNFEAIAALQPDLISGLYSGMEEDDYVKLSQIAPTIAQSDEYVDYGMPWQEVTKTIGRALGREQQAGELVVDVEAQFVEAREQHTQFVGKSVAVASSATDGQYYFLASEDGRSRPFAQLGFRVPDELDEIAGEEFFGTISGEQLDLLDRDVLVYLLEEGESRAAIEENALVQQLDVVRENRIVFVGGEFNDAINFGTVLSLPFFLDGVIPLLEAATDGDPATVPAS